MNDQPLSSVFWLITELATQLGVSKINQLEGCWVCQVDEQWLLAVNAHPTETKYNEANVLPFCAWIEYNGWPAGMINPFEGVIAAGEGANEDTLITALLNRIEKETDDGRLPEQCQKIREQLTAKI